MLTVPTYIGPSSVHGLGLYATEPVKAGTVIWQFHSAIDFIYDWRRFRQLCLNQPETLVRHLCAYTYKRNNRYYYITDNARFINHASSDSNIAFTSDHQEIATRDIEAGEELLENYYDSYDFDDFFNLEMNGIDMYQYIHVNERTRKRLYAQRFPQIHVSPVHVATEQPMTVPELSVAMPGLSVV